MVRPSADRARQSSPQIRIVPSGESLELTKAVAPSNRGLPLADFLCLDVTAASTTTARPMPQIRIVNNNLVLADGDLPLKGDCFLVVWIDSHCARGILRRFTSVATLQEDPAQQDMRVDQLWIPENGGL